MPAASRKTRDTVAARTKNMKEDATGQVHESTFEEARKALSVPLPV